MASKVVAKQPCCMLACGDAFACKTCDVVDTCHCTYEHRCYTVRGWCNSLGSELLCLAAACGVCGKSLDREWCEWQSNICETCCELCGLCRLPGICLNLLGGGCLFWLCAPLKFVCPQLIVQKSEKGCCDMSCEPGPVTVVLPSFKIVQ